MSYTDDAMPAMAGFSSLPACQAGWRRIFTEGVN